MNTGIKAIQPNSNRNNSNDAKCVDEIKRGITRGKSGKLTNLQEGVFKGGKSPHVLHEGKQSDHSPDHKSFATTETNHKNHKMQQKHAYGNSHIKMKKRQRKKTDKGKRKDAQKNESSTKDMRTNVNTSDQDKTFKRNQKPSKKKEK